MIRIKGVNKYFGNTQVLKNINVEINKGEIFGLVGHSGAGKSTLLRCINGLESYEDGSITVNNKEIKDLTSKELREFRKDLGMIFQHFSLLERLNVYENVALPLECWGYSKEEINKKVDELLRLVGLENKAKNKPKHLSGGQKQRVAIARALANQPEVLLMDEPFGALDPHTKSMMQLLMREIWEKEHPTVVFITHDIDEAVFLANKIYVMSARPGKIMKEVNVYLPHKRTLELKDSTEFIKIRKDINSLLYSSNKNVE